VEENLSAGFCGARRPGHFRGVCTVVAKLFNLAHPDFAVFGMKDFQQAAVVKRMARDLDFGIDIVVAPIVREPSGLAMSSRNKYLSPAERESALALSRSLRETSAAFAAAGGEMPWEPRKRAISAALSQAGLRPDYVEAADAETLEPVETLRKGCVVLLAAFAGKTRLIDNMVL
jgi:pantoate--beta-alanine ligase